MVDVLTKIRFEYGPMASPISMSSTPIMKSASPPPTPSHNMMMMAPSTPHHDHHLHSSASPAPSPMASPMPSPAVPPQSMSDTAFPPSSIIELSSSIFDHQQQQVHQQQLHHQQSSSTVYRSLQTYNEQNQVQQTLLTRYSPTPLSSPARASILSFDDDQCEHVTNTQLGYDYNGNNGNVNGANGNGNGNSNDDIDRLTIIERNNNNNNNNNNNSNYCDDNNSAMQVTPSSSMSHDMDRNHVGVGRPTISSPIDVGMLSYGSDNNMNGNVMNINNVDKKEREFKDYSQYFEQQSHLHVHIPHALTSAPLHRNSVDDTNCSDDEDDMPSSSISVSVSSTTTVTVTSSPSLLSMPLRSQSNEMKLLTEKLQQVHVNNSDNIANNIDTN
jgi:hypothetical protein